MVTVRPERCIEHGRLELAQQDTFDHGLIDRVIHASDWVSLTAIAPQFQ